MSAYVTGLSLRSVFSGHEFERAKKTIDDVTPSCSCNKLACASRKYRILRMEMTVLLICVLAFFHHRLLAVTSLEDFISPDQHIPSSDVFPSCVEVVEVWPPPHSALKPFNESHNTFVYYTFRITFSKPVNVEYSDTTGGYQPEMLDRSFRFLRGKLVPSGDIAPIFLSPSPTNFTRYYPYRLKNWRGSSRIFLAYFVMSSRRSGGLELTE